ncbi:MAG: glutamate-5-semialdehyde dehydrogenase [Saprospiraceae bacterium]
MTTETKNNILAYMATLLDQHRPELIRANHADMLTAPKDDSTIVERLVIDDKKIDSMIQSLTDTISKPDPIGVERYQYQHPQGMMIVNRTAPFGTILIIYESRPDVTIEAAALALKAGNRILLKGGKEARNSNMLLVQYWHEALEKFNMDVNLIHYLDYSRAQTSELLKSSSSGIDLVVPRGGDALIEMVKSLSSAPVLVSGRGNNFIYIHDQADLSNALQIIINSKLHKISVCNATDKILFDQNISGLNAFVESAYELLKKSGVEVIGDESIKSNVNHLNIPIDNSEGILYEEFLSKKIMFCIVPNADDAIKKINKYSGGHTAVIITKDTEVANHFMESVDAASVIHNASSRYTDGGQFGLGAELAISTDKLHHRGPLGLDHLVTNKWYVYGDGQIRS